MLVVLSLCPRIKLQNCSAVAFSIRAEVVDQRLEIFDLQVIHWTMYNSPCVLQCLFITL